MALGLPGVPGMLLVSVLRTTAFMGQLAYLAVLYSDRFQVGPGIFSLVWALSGITFFLGNWFGGRLLRSLTHSRHTAWTAAFAVLVGAAAVLVLFATSRLATALAATAALGAAHAVTAAAVTTLLVRGSEGHRGTVLALNGAGQSLGVCMGASVAGAGPALGGWTGAGVGLALVTVLAAVVAAHVAFSLRGRTDGAGRGKVVS
ncbi:MFS transporter [Kocuria salsicia]|uniref:MFS transporter n=1 Tax=Kocuria salsicia TaxID=664639 RepID=UPI0006D7A40F|nr:MFS transporter [Kocuria salsicia]